MRVAGAVIHTGHTGHVGRGGPGRQHHHGDDAGDSQDDGGNHDATGSGDVLHRKVFTVIVRSCPKAPQRPAGAGLCDHSGLRTPRFPRRSHEGFVKATSPHTIRYAVKRAPPPCRARLPCSRIRSATPYCTFDRSTRIGTGPPWARTTSPRLPPPTPSFLHADLMPARRSKCYDVVRRRLIAARYVRSDAPRLRVRLPRDPDVS